MALAFNTLAAGVNGTPGTSNFATASVSPSADALILAGLYTQSFSTPPATPSVASGLGLTWVQIATYNIDGTAVRLTVFGAVAGGSPGSGAITFSCGGEDTDFAGWCISECTGITGLSTVAGAVVQYGTAAEAATSITLGVKMPSVFGNAANALYVMYGNGSNVNPVFAPAGLTTLGSAGITGTRVEDGGLVGDPGNVITASSSSSNADRIWIGAEIKNNGTITPTGLTSGSNSAPGTASWNTASISPSGNALLLAAVRNRAVSGTAAAPTMTGLGLTWVQIATFNLDGGINRLTLLGAVTGGTPGSGALTFSCGGQDTDGAVWAVSEFTNVDIAGGVAGAIVQSGSGGDAAAGTVITQSLANCANAANLLYGAFSAGTTNGWTWAGATELNTGSGDVQRVETAYQSPLQVAGVLTTVAAGNKIAIAIELLANVSTPEGNVYYILNTATADGWGDVQAGGTPPSDATGSSGWTVSDKAADQYSQLNFGVERTATTFSGTAVPGAGGPDNTLKDAIRIGPISGDFAAGDWTVSLPVIAVSAGGTQDGALRVRVWKSQNADGSSPTEITSGAVQLTGVTDLTTGTPQTCSGTLSLGAITGLSNSYLFFCLAWRITGAAS